MLWFSNRRKVEHLYYEWAHMNGVIDAPMSLIAFMQIKGWLNEEKILEDIRKDESTMGQLNSDERINEVEKL